MDNICLVEDCTSVVYRKRQGLCVKHFGRWKRNGDPQALVRRVITDETTCEVQDCDAKMLARGFCSKHYGRWERHGDPNVVRTGALTKPCVVCGTQARRQGKTCSSSCAYAARKNAFLSRLRANHSIGNLRIKLLRYELRTAACEICGLTEWMGKSGDEAPLQVDHINGINDDNRLENLRILCANCHAQTDTFCGKNKGVKS